MRLMANGRLSRPATIDRSLRPTLFALPGAGLRIHSSLQNGPQGRRTHHLGRLERAQRLGSGQMRRLAQPPISKGFATSMEAGPNLLPRPAFGTYRSLPQLRLYGREPDITSCDSRNSQDRKTRVPSTLPTKTPSQGPLPCIAGTLNRKRPAAKGPRTMSLLPSRKWRMIGRQNGRKS